MLHPVGVGKLPMLICDAIKQNESELQKMKMQFYSFWYASFSDLYFLLKTPSKFN